MSSVHPSAVVERGAELGEGVTIGPFCHIGARVRIGAGCSLDSHVVVTGRTMLGARNHVAPFCVLGAPSQSKRATNSGTLVIGDDNVFREHVTVHAATEGRETRIGAHNLLMVGSHVAHDVMIGRFAVISNGVQIAGHVTVDDYVTFGGLAGVAQHVTVGESAFVAAGAMCEKNVPPFVIVQGDRARVRALNVIGLRRRGVPEASISALERAFRAVYVSKLTKQEALARIEQDDPYVARFTRALDAG